ncbi:MAG: hypothetical protein WCL16_11600 [bacterium]
MYQTRVGSFVLAVALGMSAFGLAIAAPVCTNLPPAVATNRPHGSGAGDEPRRGAWGERRSGSSDGVLQQETQITKLLGRPDVVKELNLSNDQLQVLKPAREDLTRRCEETIRKLETSLVRQVDLLKQDNPDAGALDEAVEASGRLRTELAKLRMQHLVLILKTINADQRRKLNSFLQEYSDRDKKKTGDNGRRDRVKQMLSDRLLGDANTNGPVKKP